MNRQRPGVHLPVILVSLALAAVLLRYSLRGIEWGRVWEIFRAAHLSWVLLYCGTTSVALFLRSYRWRVLLRAEGKVSVALAFRATAAGYFGNNFLPARAGEVVRTMMISSRSQLSKTFVLITALSERVADAIVLITISALVLLTIPQPPGWLAGAAKPLTILACGGIFCIAMLPVFEPRLQRVLRSVPLPESIRRRLSEMTGQIVRGVRSFHDARRIGAFAGLTAVIWCIDAAGAIIVARSLAMVLALPTAFLLIAGLGIGSALPSTPGYLGIYQFVAVSVLTPFGFARTDAIAYILLLQALGYVVISCWGLLAFVGHRRHPALQVAQAISREPA